jgi:hypothetical protein
MRRYIKAATERMATMGAILILAGVPAFVAAELLQEAPVRIDLVEIEQSRGALNEYEPGLVSVAFTNTNAVTATDVVFDLIGADGALIARYDDVGSFAHDTTQLQGFADIQAESDLQLAVSYVKFADGTSWTAPRRGAAPTLIFPAE